MELKQKPTALACYICGREFGTKSLPIHLKHCQSKFQQEQAQKEKRDRRVLPPEPTFLREVLTGNLENLQTYNEQALQIYKYQVLPACKFCGRTFNEDSLKVHLNACPKKTHIDEHPKYADSDMKKPRTLACCTCGREFGVASLKIHYPQCVEKFESDEARKPKEERRITPKFSQSDVEIFNTKTQWSSQEIEDFNARAMSIFKEKGLVHCATCGRSFMPEPYQKHLRNCRQNSKEPKEMKSNPPLIEQELKKPKVLVCFICGREFGLTSLRIHQKICKQKFTNSEKLKQKQERRPLPCLPADVIDCFPIEESEQWTTQKTEEYNQICTQVYRNQSMFECSFCKRKFIQQAYEKHLVYCEKHHQQESKPQAPTIHSQKKTEREEKSKAPIIYQTGPERDFRKQIKVENIIPETAEELEETVVFEPLQKASKDLCNNFREGNSPNNKSLSKKTPKEIEKDLNRKDEVKSPRVVEGTKPIKPAESSMKNDSNIIEQSLELQACQKCGRKFMIERLQKHQSICKAKNILDVKLQNKIKSNIQEKKQKAIQKVQMQKEEVSEQSSKLVPCSKCGRRFLENRVQKHEECCKGRPGKQREQIPNKLKEGLQSKNVTVEPKEAVTDTVISAPSKQMNSENYEIMDLKVCSKCERKFAVDRLEIHQNVCKGKPKMKVESQQRGKTMEVIKKTKDNFYRMVKDIKGKKVKEQEIDRQLEEELLTISANEKGKFLQRQKNIKENCNHEDSNGKEIDIASISKWNRAQTRKSLEREIKDNEKLNTHLPKI